MVRVSPEERDAVSCGALQVGLPLEVYARQILRAASGLRSLYPWESGLELQGSGAAERPSLLRVHAADYERAAFERAAAVAGLTLSAWVRAVLAA
jgi:hypothetical protein